MLEESFYEQRTDRNVGVIGSGQQVLRNSTAAIAGCGGMGGWIAEQCVRNGFGRVRITDCEPFDVSNLNRQMGAELATIGVNKALATYDRLKKIAGDDVEIDCDTAGISAENADSFVADADIVFDEIEFFQIRPRIVLHKAARRAGKKVINCNVIGYGTRIFLFTPESMTMEEFLGMDEDAVLDENAVWKLVTRLAPRLPEDISEITIRDWVLKRHKAPILGSTPLQSAAIAFNRAVLILTGTENSFGHKPLPPMPAYGWVDPSGFESGIKVGQWW